MPTAFIDRLDNLALVERLGAVRSLTRKARVIFAGATHDDPRPSDYSVLTEALTVIPSPLTPPFDISGNPIGPPYEALVLVERSPSLAENDPNVVDVILKYEHILDGNNQQLNLPGVTPEQQFPNILYGKGRCSIVEKTANFFYPGGDPTQGKQVILVGHTYLNNDGRIAGYPFKTPDYPMTVFQSGEVSLPFPQGNFTLMGVLSTVSPWSIAGIFIAKINVFTWLEQPPYTWICSDVQWEVMNVSNSTYKFTFEFQNNIDTWNPTVVFRDQTTGVPPSDVLRATSYSTGPGPVWNGPGIGLVPNPKTGKLQPAGMWNVGALEAVDFESLFGSYFEGLPPPAVL